MTYQVQFIEKQQYLHVKVTGENSIENVKQYLQEVLKKCIETRSSHLLIEEQLEGPRLDMLKVFEIAAEGSTQAHGVFKAVAYVDTNAVGDLMQFAETVAVNRAMPVKIFSSVTAAEQWLLAKK